MAAKDTVSSGRSSRLGVVNAAERILGGGKPRDEYYTLEIVILQLHIPPQPSPYRRTSLTILEPVLLCTISYSNHGQ